MPTRSLVWPLLAVLTLLAPPVSGGAADQAAPPASAAPPPASAPIPLAEVATRAAEVSNLLPTFTAQLAPSAAIETILVRLPEISERINADMSSLGEILRADPSLGTISAQQQLWQERQHHATEWLNLLTRRATQLQDGLSRLAAIQERWRQTQADAQAANAPIAILQQIDAVLADLAQTESPFQAQRAAVLGLQSRVAREVARCGTALDLLAQAEQAAMGGMLSREAPPIWSAELWARARAGLPTRFGSVSAGRWAEIVQYVHDPTVGMPLHVGFLVVAATLFSAARRWIRRGAATGEGESFATTVFNRPYSAALILTLLSMSTVLSPAPPTVRQLAIVLMLVPAIRLVQPVVDPQVIPRFYILGALFAVDTLRQALAGIPLLEQGLLALEMLAGLAAVGWALRFGYLQSELSGEIASERRRALRAGATLVLLILSAALVAGTFGYMRLGRLLASGVVGSAALALVLYAYVQVGTGVVALCLRLWPLRRLQMVQHHRSMLERRVHRGLIWLASFFWLTRSLDYVGFLGPVLALGQRALTARLERGAFSLSLADVLAFILAVWAAFLLSAFLRFVLQEDVYPRIHVTRGISYAVSSLLHYMILALGFLAGLGLLGLDLTRLTIVASAFGVGIGFGLQSVVNNFVSGLILLFERPIHVGDVIQMGDLSGEVRRIGIRASLIRTGQGAEIIVPNAQLISDRVTNWTLSDRHRRIELPVGVTYSAPPQKVIELLEAVGQAHPLVLRDPAPRAFFTSFGDSTINYELRAWTDDIGQWAQIHSELAAAVYTALQGAGLEIPFPQRVVRVLRDGPGAADTGEAPIR
jgi:potassium-dependent mechanosensitive channel